MDFHKFVDFPAELRNKVRAAHFEEAQIILAKIEHIHEPADQNLNSTIEHILLPAGSNSPLLQVCKDSRAQALLVQPPHRGILTRSDIFMDVNHDTLWIRDYALYTVVQNLYLAILNVAYYPLWTGPNINNLAISVNCLIAELSNDSDRSILRLFDVCYKKKVRALTFVVDCNVEAASWSRKFICARRTPISVLCPPNMNVPCPFHKIHATAMDKGMIDGDEEYLTWLETGKAMKALFGDMVALELRMHVASLGKGSLLD